MTAPTQIDYQAVLADLEAKRGQLDAAIAGIKAMLSGATVEDGSGDASETAQTPKPPVKPAPKPPGGTVVESDTFFGLSSAEAVKKFLTMMKRPQPPRAIADALHQGGQVHATDEKTAYTNTYTALKRGKDKLFSQTRNGDWGLAEWYTNKPKGEAD